VGVGAGRTVDRRASGDGNVVPRGSQIKGRRLADTSAGAGDEGNGSFGVFIHRWPAEITFGPLVPRLHT
jgi:hypothetical protein